MKAILFVPMFVLSASALAQPARSNATSELPRELAVQEQYVLLTAKLKNLAETQDLIVQQQQLMLQHLDVLRREVSELQHFRSNSISRAQIESTQRKVEELQKLLEANTDANTQNACRLLQGILSQREPELVSPETNQHRIAGRYEKYRVQQGDTLLKVLYRWNEVLEKQNLPRLTVEQIERANPGLTADRIRVGQVLTIPIPERL